MSSDNTNAPKPTVLFVVTSLAAMAWLTLLFAEQAGVGIVEMGPDLALALCGCLPIGLIHIAAIFLSLFRRDIGSTYAAITLYGLELAVWGSCIPKFVRRPDVIHHLTWPDFVGLGSILLCILCLFPAWSWLRRLKRARAVAEAEPPDTPVS